MLPVVVYKLRFAIIIIISVLFSLTMSFNYIEVALSFPSLSNFTFVKKLPQEDTSEI
jgi:hypothetical protein